MLRSIDVVRELENLKRERELLTRRECEMWEEYSEMTEKRKDEFDNRI